MKGILTVLASALVASSVCAANSSAQDHQSTAVQHTAHHASAKEVNQHQHNHQNAVKSAHIHDHQGNVAAANAHAKDHHNSQAKAHNHDHKQKTAGANAHSHDHEAS